MLGFWKSFLKVYFWEKERERTQGGGRLEREGDTEAEAGPRLWAVGTEPEAGLEPTDHEIMTWAEVRHLTNWATQVPRLCYVFELQVDELGLGIVQLFTGSEPLPD